MEPRLEEEKNPLGLYRMKQGDVFEEVCAQCGVPALAVIRLNRLKRPPEAGEFFCLPQGREVTEGADTMSASAAFRGENTFGTLLVPTEGRNRSYIQNKQNSTMNIKPLADRVLILPAPAEEKTVGGIIIPDTAKEKPLKGEVMAVGHGTKDEEMVLKVGDTVLYGKYSGTEIEVDGEKYLMMRQSDVLAVIG